MKRIVALVLSLLLVIGMLSFASADTIPTDILNQLDRNDVVLSSAQLGTSEGTTWFLIVRTWSNKNILYLFKQFNGSSFYRKLIKNEMILPNETNMLLYLRNEETDPWTGDEFVGPVLDIDQLGTSGDTLFRMVFQFNGSDDDWNIIRIWDTQNRYISAEFDSTKVYEYYDYKSSNVRSSYALKLYRNLKDAKLSDFAKSGGSVDPEKPQKQHEYSSTPIALPQSSEFIADNGVSFEPNKRYAVYSGPSENAVRGANNKAVVSTNDWIQVFGREGDWVLVNYGIGKNHYRFGYIKASSLPNGYTARELSWIDMPAKVLSNVIVTDDPFYSQAELVTIQADTQVLWLGTLGDWAYVESDNFRGFIPLSYLGVHPDG